MDAMTTVPTSVHDPGDEVVAVAWSPDGTRVVVGKWWKDQVQAWDANTGQHVVPYRAPGLQDQAFAVVWLPNGQTLAAGGNGFVWVWNEVSGDIVTTYTRHTDGVIALANSPDGKYIVSGGYDDTVQVWEVITGRTIVTYLGHSSDVYAVAWSPDGQHIASGGKDKTVQVWPVRLFENDGQQQSSAIITYRGHTAAVQAVAWSPDSRTLASAAENVQLWNALTGRHIFTYTGHEISAVKQVVGLAWSPNGRYIASGGMEGTVQVWHATNQGKGNR
jgi:Tol biopolymer transport system component